MVRSFRTCSGSRCRWSRTVHLLLALSIGSCSRPASIKIAVVFSTTWAFESLNQADQAVVKRAALDTLRQAFDGFDVVFAETAAGDRTIRIEDTPYASNPGQLISFGAAGVTYPAAMVSSVHDDVLFSAELAAVRCPKVNECTKTRTELIEALGTGIGATAAHELGHQTGFGFSHDSPCVECYDGKSSTAYVHFFGVKHWSDQAVRRMRQVLPRK